jgi:hypothetical protein
MDPHAADPAPAVELARRGLLDPARWRQSPQRSRTTKPTVREREGARHWRVHGKRYIGRPGNTGLAEDAKAWNADDRYRTPAAGQSVELDEFERAI